MTSPILSLNYCITQHQSKQPEIDHLLNALRFIADITDITVKLTLCISFICKYFLDKNQLRIRSIDKRTFHNEAYTEEKCL